MVKKNQVLEMADFSRAHPVMYNVNALHVAVKEGIVTQLEQSLCDRPGAVNKLDEDGYGPVHYAARYNRTQIIEKLAKYGCDMNAKSLDSGTALHIAARVNCMDAVQALLRQGAKVDSLDAKGQTPLHFASRKGYAHIVQVLLDAGATAHSIDHDLSTPIHQAAINGDVNTCRLLMGAGADNRCWDISHVTPLMLAAAEGNVGVMELFLSAGTRYGTTQMMATAEELLGDRDMEGATSLHYAAENGMLQAVHLCLKYNTDVNAKRGTFRKEGSPQDNQATALHLACMQGFTSVVERLLDGKAWIEARDAEHMTPLHRASLYNRQDVVELLLKRGANIDAEDANNYTALHHASSKGHTDLVIFLLTRDANIKSVTVSLETCLHLSARSGNYTTTRDILVSPDGGGLLEMKDSKDQTVLHYAARVGDIKTVKFLLEKTADPSIKDRSEKSPLHIAAEHGNKGCVETLIKASASQTNDHDIDGMTPLMLASADGHDTALETLLALGADITCRDDDGHTSLMLAAKKGHVRCVSILMEHGLDINIQDRQRNTALHFAARNGHTAVVKMLTDDQTVLSQQNNQNQTPLDLALENGYKDSVIALLTHPRWRQVMNVRSDSGLTPMDKLIQRMPEAAEIVLDQCIAYSHKDPHHPELQVMYDFQYVDPGPDDAACKNSMYFGMKTMVDCRQDRLVSHPLCLRLLEGKWSRFTQWCFLADVLFYTTYVIFMCVWLTLNSSNFITNTDIDPDGCPIPAVYRTNATTLQYYKKHSQPKTQVSSDGRMTATIILYIFICISVLRECARIYHKRLRYFGDLFNYMLWLLYVCTFMFVYPPGYAPCSLQWQFGVAAVFIAWLNFMSFLNLSDWLGLYVMMFASVIQSILKVTLMFSFLIVGFAFAFWIMLSRQTSYGNFGLALVKVLAMMVGEFDYTSTFVEEKNEPFYVESHVIFGVFLLVMSITLTNLLIGVAVGDIDRVKKDATLRKIGLRVDMVYATERFLPRGIQRKLHKAVGTYKPNAQLTSIFKQIEHAFLGKHREEQSNALKSVNDQLEEQNKKIEYLEKQMSEQRQLLLQIQESFNKTLKSTSSTPVS